MDRQCLEYLWFSTDLFRRAYDNKLEVVINQEIAMSQLVLQAKWNLSCLIPEYQGRNYTDPNSYPKIFGDIIHPHNELGRLLHPYEVLFLKTERHVNTDVIESLTWHHLVAGDLMCRKNSSIKIAICFHLGYGHMWSQLAPYLRRVYQTGYQIDLYVSY